MTDIPESDAAPVDDWLAHAERAVIVALFIGMTVLGAVQVVSRHLLVSRISSLEQLLPNLFVVLCFLGLSAAFRTRGNIAVTFLTDALPAGVRRRYEVGMWLVTIGFMAVVAWSGVSVVLFQIQIGAPTSLGYPAALLTATVPVGCVLSIVRIVQIELRPLLRGRP
jgi:TRAP-type C4-dicarboxylate transport system permease small subunit